MRWEFSCRCITAQAMRAVLFANATATTRLGRRLRSPITHGSALVAFERSRLALAPLIRSRRKYWFPRLDMPPNRFLPPVEFCRGTRPSHAARQVLQVLATQIGQIEAAVTVLEKQLSVTVLGKQLMVWH